MSIDPCDFNSDVYQSPIALTNNDSIFNSRSKLKPIKGRIISHYNPDLKQWDVLNDINTSNNELDYRLTEFHFHHPGEHIINDARYPLEIHFVFEDHKDFSVLVIGYPIKLQNKSSEIFVRIIKDKPFAFPSSIRSDCKKEASLGSYYSYPGSLTTQPFDFNVSWILMSKPLNITENDLNIIAQKSKPPRELHPRAGRDVVYAIK
ncbi:Carbonic anhydrase [uncultured virus]|nr:Carbonic anhydrase [uncultured virus]